MQPLENITEEIDLRAFFRSVGQFRGDRALISNVVERSNPEQPVINIESVSSPIEAAPLKIKGFVDGIQSAMTLTWREHRPVYFSYTSAGCVGDEAQLLVLREKLEILCSTLDRGWVESLDEKIDARYLEECRPDQIERAALASLAAQRDEHERSVITELLSGEELPFIVDGSLIARPIDNRVCAVIKTTRRRWLSDETVLWNLPEGWRSPRFIIPAGSQGVSVDRYSCYLRLFDATARSWDYGLIRLETFNPELLDPLAALALAERQNPAAGDPRVDRHLDGVRTCEKVLRVRRPAVFALR